MFAVVVTIEAVSGKEGALIEALEGNAGHSRKEPGCLTWEWSRHIDDDSRFAIYEIYASREAFLEHKESEHFASWVEASAPCIKVKEAGQYNILGRDTRVGLPGA
ncbi:MAG: antibiotic biosynthesis monooxygenase [Verrucomicrobiales bacterium]|jgi:quinol monooxygenase YgiN|nr:antibiotic biosynthesis monooxygenase [Verrucomicrobiales bacterium]|tara:strand:- start:71362 stop:71676 length:315 start_codon:yes stop_codon:yes gene_type:complete